MQNTTATSPINSFILKVLAIVTMTANHAANAFASVLSLEAYVIMTGVGGLTFPIMAYLMLIGYNHTRNVWKYMGRLLIFAVIAQIPYTFLYGRPNVLFTLAVGLFLYWLYDNSSRVVFWFLAITISLCTAIFDWGLFGPLCMVGLRVLEKYNKVVAIVVPIGLIGLIHMSWGYGCAYSGVAGGLETIGVGVQTLCLQLTGRLPFVINDPGGFATVLYSAMNIVSAVILVWYNGERGYPLKYFFYVYYPLHLTVILGLTYVVGIR